jgi:hypothetical protein
MGGAQEVLNGKRGRPVGNQCKSLLGRVQYHDLELDGAARESAGDPRTTAGDQAQALELEDLERDRHPPRDRVGLGPVTAILPANETSFTFAGAFN